jgi:hypothetical protein
MRGPESDSQEGNRMIKAVNNGVEAELTRFASTDDGCESGCRTPETA